MRFRPKQCSLAGTLQIVGKAASSYQNLLALLALLGLAVLASGCAGASALSAASMLGSPSASALEIHNNTDVGYRKRISL